jgi:hypothetical protein
MFFLLYDFIKKRKSKKEKAKRKSLKKATRNLGK